jgi:7-cyano-7-deazaguanine synthase
MKALVLHSGGMDSSICLLLACKKYGADQVVSVGFRYAQRHASELEAARYIANTYNVQRVEIEVPVLLGWETSSLVNKQLAITKSDESLVSDVERLVTNPSMPNSFVPGRNGLFLMMAAPFAKSIGATCMYLGILEQEGANSGYPDCSRVYVDLVQKVIRADLQDETFDIETPLVSMSKRETLFLAKSLGELSFLLEHTVTCYEGIPKDGCQKCPACILRNKGITEFLSRAT